jgi:non-specific serine/threonine protein kinase/serine/threonine-protein kinase
MVVGHRQLIAGRYRLGPSLGSGGMGTVYAGHDLRLDRDVAIKVLRPELARDLSLRRRFEREARAAARVSHPHVVAVYDTGEDPDADVYIVMERLTGRTLVDELRTGPLGEARVREVAMSVLGGLGAAHARGLVHRDVKPGNILLARDGTLKVGDFGIATSLEPDETTTRVPLGTTAYTAPERLRGLPATERSDLYALGVVLYEAAAGVRPFTGDDSGAVAEAAVVGAHTSLGDLRIDLSSELVTAVERALATDPRERFASVDEMRAALDRASGGLPSAGTAVTAPLSRPLAATAALPSPTRSRRPAPITKAPVTKGPTTKGWARRWARRPGDAPSPRLVVAVVLLAVIAIAGVLLLAGSGDTPNAVPPAAPTTVASSAVASSPVASSPVVPASAPVPAPLQRALQRLEQAARP